MIRWTLRQARGIIAVSAALKRAMVELGTQANKIHVVPNGVDHGLFETVPMVGARPALDLAPDNPMFVSVGALMPSKGHDVLIRAFGQIAGRHPGWELYILGEGRQRSELDRLICELRLQGRVHMPGKRPT